MMLSSSADDRVRGHRPGTTARLIAVGLLDLGRPDDPSSVVEPPRGPVVELPDWGGIAMARSTIAIVGAGFAGYHAAHTLSRLLRGRAEIALINPMDYFLYLPLLPEVAAGVIDPRRVAVSLPETLPDVRLVLGEADGVDLDARQVGWVDAEGSRGGCGYDRLVLAVGSVNKLLLIPGVNEHAHGFRGISEALYLRDHMTRQVELADLTDDAAERAARTTFVVVGAGYTGTEVAAQ